MKYILLANRYAKAFMNCYEDNSDKCKNAEKLIEIINRILIDMDVYSELQNPSVVYQKKENLIKSFLPKDNVLISNFLSLLLKKDRIFILSAIVISLKELIFEFNSMVAATAYSSVSLRDIDKKVITDQLQSFFNKQVDLQTYVDESILAGVRVESNNYIFDATLDNSLKNLKLAFQ